VENKFLIVLFSFIVHHVLLFTLSFLGVFEGIRTSSVFVFATNSIGGYSISSIPVLE
jgi:hypothetical protein